MATVTSPRALDFGIAAALGAEVNEVRDFRISAGARGHVDTRARGLSSRRDRMREAAILLPALALNISQRKRLEMLSVFPELKPESRPRFKDNVLDPDVPLGEWGEPYVPSEVLTLPADASLTDHLEAVLRSLTPSGSFYECERALGEGKRLRCEAVFSTSGIARIDFLVDEAWEGRKFHTVATCGVRFGDWSSLDIIGLAQRKLPPATYVTVTTGSLAELASHMHGEGNRHD